MSDTTPSQKLKILLDFQPTIHEFDDFKVVMAVACADGFHMSVQAGATHYARRDDDNVYSAEVGYPSEIEETLMEYCEDPSNPLDTVYGYVPAEVIMNIIEKHGGAVFSSNDSEDLTSSEFCGTM